MSKAKVAMLVMLLMVLAITGACSGGGNSGSNHHAGDDGVTNGNNPNGGGNADGTQDSAHPPEQQEPTIDLKGEPVKILIWYGEPEPGTQEGDLRIARQKEVEEKYNTKIEWVKVPWGESINMLTNAALSGEPVADIVALNIYHAIPAINQGLLMPVDDFFDFDDPKWPKRIKEFGSWSGKMYGFTEAVKDSSGLYYNKTLFKREGLPDPHDLVAQDKWNWDTFLEIARRATKDTDGDGVPDQWGLTNSSSILMRIMIYSNNGKLMDQKDGKWMFTPEDPNMLEALHFFSDLFHKYKVIFPNDGQDDYGKSQQLFIDGKAAMVTGELWEGAERKTMTDEQGFVYFPKGPGADQYSNTISNFVMWYMPANAKRPKEVAKIWEDLILWDRIELQKREAAEAQNVADEKDIEVMMNITDIVQPLYLPLGGALEFVAHGIAVNGEVPETLLETHKQLAQDTIDSMLNTPIQTAQ
jgi:ABC-type sugar transport system, periplasmic component